MLTKYKILTVSFIIIASIISLFPPFSWGDEKLRTLSERRQTNFLFEDNIPIKDYDFLFNDIKREFVFSNHKITLERHLIVSELVIETFIAFLIAIVLQFAYSNYTSKKVLTYSYIITTILFCVLAFPVLNTLLTWFQPDYSKVVNVENKIKIDYKNLILDNNVREFSNIVTDLRRGYQKNWERLTEKYWYSINSKIELENYQYPGITNFLEKSVVIPKPKYKKSKYNLDYFINPDLDWDYQPVAGQKYSPWGPEVFPTPKM